MKKNVYQLDNIDCASCALKIEHGVSKLDGIETCSLNVLSLKLIVSFDEATVSDETIETCIHKSLRGVQIVRKNGEDFTDTYEAPPVFKKIFFGGRGKK